MVTRFKCSPDSEEREENEEENDEDTGYSWAKIKQRHTTDVLLHIPRDTDEDSSEERFCLAMLLLIESTFLTLYKGCKFPVENLERAQDVEKLTNYPWGEDAFNVPMSSIKKNSIPMLQTAYNRISLIERPTAFLCEKYTSLPSPQLSQIQNIEASYHPKVFFILPSIPDDLEDKVSLEDEDDPELDMLWERSRSPSPMRTDFYSNRPPSPMEVHNVILHVLVLCNAAIYLFVRFASGVAR
ncbi:hypothetical protein AXX17_ATUG01820 [Arabidopsis thaliana]|uniref:DUF1985 domain-containing protein n=1 Tax=Arabidopsis thaliana TaxID=3702 RepID=A0A178U5Y1_ARATH|nr:hypothetical protein AXX17_ATUG01820 [Arabidopsis thaliana]